MGRHFHLFTLDHKDNGDPYTRTFAVRSADDARREVDLEIGGGRRTTTVEPCDHPACLGPEPALYCRGHHGKCQSGAPSWSVGR